MNEIIRTLNGWSDIWLCLMWAISWQSILLVGLVGLVVLLLRRSSPVVRYWLWQIVAIKLLLMPFWTWAVELPAWIDVAPTGGGIAVTEWPLPRLVIRDEAPLLPPAELVEEATVDAAMPTPPWSVGDITWPSWLLMGWASVVGLLLARLVRQRILLGRLLRDATPAGEKLMLLVRELSEQLAVGRCPAVVLTGTDCPLFVCGLRRPVMVLPSTLARSLDPDRLRQALLHEMAHVKRRDLLWGWPMEIVKTVFFFHPVVYWVAYHLRLERELACDQQAMALSGHSPGEYANTLIDVGSHTSQPVTVNAAAAISAGLAGNAALPRQRRTDQNQS